MQVWQVMEPAIDSERTYREKKEKESDVPPGFLVYYEHLVARIIDLDGKEAAIKIQRALISAS